MSSENNHGNPQPRTVSSQAVVECGEWVGYRDDFAYSQYLAGCL